MCKSFKACANYFNNPFLIFLGHLIITGQAASALKYIRADVCHPACNVGIGAAPERALSAYRLMHAVHGLHMHGLSWRSGANAAIYSGLLVLQALYVVFRFFQNRGENEQNKRKNTKNHGKIAFSFHMDFR